MLLWAMAPAREPATSLSAMPNVSWLLPINRLICQTGRPFVTHQRDTWQKYVAYRSCAVAYLFIRHELNSRLRGDFDDVDSVASPQWPHTALTDHLSKAATDVHAVALGGVNLGRPKPGQTVLFTLKSLIRLPLYSLSRMSHSPIHQSSIVFYLHEDFEPVQWCCAGSRNSTSSSSSYQVSPPHSCLLLFCSELIWHHQTFPNIKDLRRKQRDWACWHTASVNLFWTDKRIDM